MSSGTLPLQSSTKYHHDVKILSTTENGNNNGQTKTAICGMGGSSIGEGTFGSVIVAYDDDGNEFALKLFVDNGDSDNEYEDEDYVDEDEDEEEEEEEGEDYEDEDEDVNYSEVDDDDDDKEEDDDDDDDDDDEEEEEDGEDSGDDNDLCEDDSNEFSDDDYDDDNSDDESDDDNESHEINNNNNIMDIGTLREISILRLLRGDNSHKSIVNMIDVIQPSSMDEDEDEDEQGSNNNGNSGLNCWGLVLPLFRMGTLTSAIDSKHYSLQSRRGKLSITYNLLSALRFLHDRGIIHRDIKGENVMLVINNNNNNVQNNNQTTKGIKVEGGKMQDSANHNNLRPILIDFSLAKVIDPVRFYGGGSVIANDDGNGDCATTSGDCAATSGGSESGNDIDTKSDSNNIGIINKDNEKISSINNTSLSSFTSDRFSSDILIPPTDIYFLGNNTYYKGGGGGGGSGGKKKKKKMKMKIQKENQNNKFNSRKQHHPPPPQPLTHTPEIGTNTYRSPEVVALMEYINKYHDDDNDNDNVDDESNNNHQNKKNNRCCKPCKKPPLYSFPSDIYSIGVIALELLRGSTLETHKDKSALLKVENESYLLPKNMPVPDLIRGLVHFDVTKRWGIRRAMNCDGFRKFGFIDEAEKGKADNNKGGVKKKLVVTEEEEGVISSSSNSSNKNKIDSNTMVLQGKINLENALPLDCYLINYNDNNEIIKDNRDILKKRIGWVRRIASDLKCRNPIVVHAAVEYIAQLSQLEEDIDVDDNSNGHTDNDNVSNGVLRGGGTRRCSSGNRTLAAATKMPSQNLVECVVVAQRFFETEPWDPIHLEEVGQQMNNNNYHYDYDYNNNENDEDNNNTLLRGKYWVNFDATSYCSTESTVWMLMDYCLYPRRLMERSMAMME